MKKICVITGASSGIGKEFFEKLAKDSELKFDEFWVIARSADKLAELSSCSDTPVRVLPLDLSKRESFDEYRRALDESGCTVGLLVNCAGFGKFDSTMKVGLETSLNMIDLNVDATVALDMISCEYMEKGSGIINIASVAAYQPIPYINVYGSTKAFVLNFTRALAMELKPKGIHVMAVCPFWTKTEFFGRAVNKDEEAVVKKYVLELRPIYAPSNMPVKKMTIVISIYPLLFFIVSYL